MLREQKERGRGERERGGKKGGGGGRGMAGGQLVNWSIGGYSRLRPQRRPLSVGPEAPLNSRVAVGGWGLVPAKGSTHGLEGGPRGA